MAGVSRDCILSRNKGSIYGAGVGLKAIKRAVDTLQNNIKHKIIVLKVSSQIEVATKGGGASEQLSRHYLSCTMQPQPLDLWSHSCFSPSWD
jgi:hypothetical protein